jgi:predicted GIY-YIG superfamily endonuclease
MICSAYGQDLPRLHHGQQKARRALYTGVTGNPAGRVWQHKSHVSKGSFTDRYDCDMLVWYEVMKT